MLRFNGAYLFFARSFLTLAKKVSERDGEVKYTCSKCDGKVE
jgi:hypothetical protein